MTLRAGPPIDRRRTAEFLAELRQRARAWIPSWQLDEDEPDFGRALLEIAARFSSEVAERLDRGADKMQRGFFDWLAVRGVAARPARVPVVFTLADTATAGVLASAPVGLQADAAGIPVAFETETDVRLVPGRIDGVVAVDADSDAYYLPPPGLSDLQPVDPAPTLWQARSFASVGATTIQLDPEAGLVAGTILEAGGRQYRIVGADKDLVTIEPPLEQELPEAAPVTKVTTFVPFGATARNWQEHALYFGDPELLNIEAAATIEVAGSARLRTGFTWEYWGTNKDSDEAAWRQLPLDADRQDAIVLTKPQGSIEQKEIGGRGGRWIRAYAKTVGADDESITADAFALRINAARCTREGSPCPPPSDAPSAPAEAMANNTPLVLDNIFLPLGREPRQFDAFYLASAEAFSKQGARVRLCFELADPTFTALTVVREGAYANVAIAGVGKDHALHLFVFLVAADGTPVLRKLADRGALRPPAPADNGEPPPQSTPISLNEKCRPVIVTEGNDFYVSVAAGGAIWQWHENAADPKLSGWIAFDRFPGANPPARVDDIVPVSLADTTVVLAGCELWAHDGNEWARKETIDTTPNPDVPVTLVALVPVLLNNSGALAPTDRMVGVGVTVNNNQERARLYKVTLQTDLAKCDPLPLGVAPNEQFVDAGTGPSGRCKTGGLRPAAYADATGLLAVVTAGADRDKLVAYVKSPLFTDPDIYEIALPQDDRIDGATVDISFVNDAPQFSVLCRTQLDATYVASWQPLEDELRAILFRSSVPGGRLNGAPVTLPAHIIAPGARGDLFVADFNPVQRLLLAADTPEDGVVLRNVDVPFAVDDVLSVIDATPDRIFRTIAKDGLESPVDPEVLYAVDQPFGPVSSELSLIAYRHSGTALAGTIVDADTLLLDGSDLDVYLVIDDTNLPTVGVYPPLPQSTGNADYWTPEPANGRVAPILRLNLGVSGPWPATSVPRSRLYFPTAEPDVQAAKVFEIFADRPKIVSLQAPWVQSPALGDPFVVDATLGDWRHMLADTSTNPELSWEYSNGTAWTSLLLEEESTLNLKNTGAVRFRVPKDLAATDWAGKTNHWIRARLIGGDYGREQVKVRTKDLGNDESEQTVERSLEGLRPPAVIKLHISYGVCEDTRPEFLLTQDSGSTRDQSDANRTAGAIVEAFVPLSLMLGRLLNAAPPDPSTQQCPPGCACHSSPAAVQGAPAAAAPATATDTRRVRGRSVFVGLTKEPSGEPVNVLILVEAERDRNQFAPLLVRAHVADRFVPLVADDKTRALGESGLLTMAFTVPPTLRELFGLTRAWLHLAPDGGSVADWRPALRGAYLNGVWAAATETLTRELLGSSDGAPNLTVKVARPPLLEGTLELRVREPLGEEERAALRAGDPGLVLNPVDGLDGDWVRWEQVTDPGDEPASARVYALDESSGVIRFGDGRHGRIPPVGVDSIVAFKYQRTEPGPPGSVTVPGNTISARMPLNLVTPVETAESAIAADQAAGGAPPETADRVLRFGVARLRHRSRAVSAHDLEDLALQSSPDIAQARAFARRGHLRLVVVMRGKTPGPNAAQVRELSRLLLDAAPATLSAPQALRIAGPDVRRLRVALSLRVRSLDVAGAVSRDVRDRLSRLFDTTTGGVYGEGWPLGTNPTEQDIAYALIDATRLESLAAVKLYEVLRDGHERPWPGEIKPTELAMLADDPIRLNFVSAEAVA